MDDADAPLLDAWRVFVESGVTPFTIPGHKRRAATQWQTLGRVLDSDVPLYAGLGTMKDAAAVLERAEARGAQLWAADWCRYSTGGSTHVNQVAALAVGRPRNTVLVSRTAHRSTLSGLILAGLRPVWLPSELDPTFGLPRGVPAAALETALAAHPDAVAVFLVEPSYVGTVSDLPALVALAHDRDVPVVVDQAWGAHFGFHPDYPAHALQAGADVMIASAHKTLPAYSQAAIIAARCSRLDGGRLDRAFDLAATTSPAGSILASIDASRALLESATGRALLDRLVGLVATARDRLRRAGVVVPDPADFPAGRYDPAKLVLLFPDADGLRIEQALIAARIPVEHADRDTVVAIVTMLDDEATIDRLVNTVVGALAPSGEDRRAVSSGWTAPVPQAAMTPREAFFAPHEVVAIDDAVGRASAELIAPYPPGIPLLAPGEVVTRDLIDALLAAAASGTRIAYARDPSLATCEVVIE